MVEYYVCPVCKTEAKIDRVRKTKEINYNINPNKSTVVSFPSHSGCELVKPVGKIDYSKLEKKVVV